MAAIKCSAVLQKKQKDRKQRIFSLNHICVFGIVVIIKHILKPSLTPVFDIKSVLVFSTQFIFNFEQIQIKMRPAHPG